MTTVTAKPLFTSKIAETSETTQYTVPASTRTIIDKFTAHNSTGANITATVKIVQSGGTAGASHVVVSRALAAAETYTFPEVVGHVMEAGGFLSTLASATGLNIRASGREVV